MDNFITDEETNGGNRSENLQKGSENTMDGAHQHIGRLQKNGNKKYQETTVIHLIDNVERGVGVFLHSQDMSKEKKNSRDQRTTEMTRLCKWILEQRGRTWQMDKVC